MEPIVFECVYRDIPVEKVWETVTHLQNLNIWDFKTKMTNIVEGSIFEFYEPNGTDYFHVCKVTELKENKLLEHTWSYPLLSKGESKVQWNLHQQGNDTTLEFKHFGTENFKDDYKALSRENFVAGWTELVTQMIKEYLNKLIKSKGF